jgi:hypothetical protein
LQMLESAASPGWLDCNGARNWGSKRKTAQNGSRASSTAVLRRVAAAG